MDKRSSNSVTFYVAFSLGICLAALMPLQAIADESDPIEPVNRVVHNFNEFFDRWLLRPTATAYHAVMPEFGERGVRNFFSNIGEVRNATHNALQGKFGGAATSTGRLLINSTVGIGGLFDVATKVGIPVQQEDLGQTLGVWGFGSGPYLVLPLLGPSSLRDSFGVVADPFLSPITYAPLNSLERTGFVVVDGVQTRADLLSSEGIMMGDTYTLYRGAYLSTREYAVNDGRILSDDFLDDDPVGFDSEEDFVDEGFIDESF